MFCRTQYRQQCQPENMQVHGKGAMLNIVQPQTNLFRANQLVIGTMRVRAAAQNLIFVAKPDGSPVRNAGANQQQILFFIGVGTYFVHDFGARPDEAHFTLQHVQQLRQFVQLIFAQKVPCPCDPWIIGRGLGSADLFGIKDHGAQFPNAEGTPQTSGAHAPIKHRPGGIESDPYRANCQQRRDQQKSTEGNDNIKESFHCPLPRSSAGAAPWYRSVSGVLVCARRATSPQVCPFRSKYGRGKQKMEAKVWSEVRLCLTDWS